MTSERARVRLNFTARELEIDGPVAVVRELIEEYRPMVENAPLPAPAPATPGYAQPAGGSAPVSSAARPGDVPESFGEYLHAFPDSLSGPDKALIAAVYVQAHSDDNSFSTRDVNALLKEHAIRLANASVTVKRIVDAKHAFSIARGRFRVSTEGHGVVDDMQRGQTDG